MAVVGVIYFSGTGTTKKLASYVQQGIEDAGSTCHLLEVVGGDIIEGRWANDGIAEILDECDAVVFGSPTYMGSISAQLKAFLDAMAPRWYTQVWNGKYAAAFTASSLSAGDKLNCLFDITIFAMQMGMIWVGTGASFPQGLNPNGFYLGVGAVASSPDQLTELDINTALHLGRRVAGFAG
jgi:NAD(P)H dehydrogenase (quinone)